VKQRAFREGLKKAVSTLTPAPGCDSGGEKVGNNEYSSRKTAKSWLFLLQPHILHPGDSDETSSVKGGGAGNGLQELFASYKVTALQDVTIRACVDEKPEWVNLQAGEVVHGVKTVLGVHPNDAPEHRAIHAFGATFVMTDTAGTASCRAIFTGFCGWNRKIGKQRRGQPRFSTEFAERGSLRQGRGRYRGLDAPTRAPQAP
jgi:hypothetical protein